MFRLKFIPADFFRPRFRVNRMQVETFFPRDEGKGEFRIQPKLIPVFGPAGIIPGSQDASAGRGGGAFKAGNIVTLPAMDRNGNVRRCVYRRIRINSVGGVNVFSYGIIFLNSILTVKSLHFLLLLFLTFSLIHLN